jgi:hypothetical protein
MAVFGTLFLFTKPGEMLHEGAAVTPDELSILGDTLRGRLHEAAAIVENLAGAGWEAQMLLYQVELSHQSLATAAQVRQQLQQLGIDPERLHIEEEEEEKGLEEGRQDEIEALGEQAEEDLKRFRVPDGVEHRYYSDYDRGSPLHHSWCWGRYGKGWRIVYQIPTASSEIDETHDDVFECKPITECALDLRLAMIPEFESLRQKVVEAAEKAVPTRDEAISRCRKSLKS